MLGLHFEIGYLSSNSHGKNSRKLKSTVRIYPLGKSFPTMQRFIFGWRLYFYLYKGDSWSISLYYLSEKKRKLFNEQASRNAKAYKKSRRPAYKDEVL